MSIVNMPKISFTGKVGLDKDSNNRKVYVVSLDFKPKIENEYVIFENDYASMLFNKDDKMYVDNVIIDPTSKQRFFISDINLETVTHKFNVKDGENVVECKRALLKRFSVKE